ncbi:isocitrate lyase/phosphoenolpyruvate mutase family protein [Altererythrobacter sp. ZODW24]|uniref:isocitrate lyase/PEP mutase family protein n=1 Tax=Altererythrobacter sp. ZODW24 TaxID=2185142 RepID=UPI000DF7B555|nr:isocitrate lyase/phosphoenolpyruvate mutase family protein [Altererythrobacter sp. ZODW24]
MTSVSEFAAMHVPGNPLVLCNIWDAASARIAAEAGAKALATGSSALAGALGFDDAQAIPFDMLIGAVERIQAVSDLPLTVDFEAGYSDDLAGVAENAQRLTDMGVVGCNFEDQVIGGQGLIETARQAELIAAVAATGLFVNARTDVFLERLRAGENANDPELLPEVLERGHAYAAAGAGSFFIPGLSDSTLIAVICEKSPIPVNVMRLPDMASNAALADLSVARISYGPAPWNEAMAAFRRIAEAAYSA